MPADLPGTPGPEVVLHEERLDVGTERDVVRAVVRRRVVEETRRLEVTVRREVLEVEYLPADESERAAPPGPAPSPVVVVLSEEVPVVTLQTRPYERVTVTVDSVEEQQQVSAQVGREQVEVTTS